MTSLESDVFAAFIERLKESDDVPADVAEQLRAAMASAKLPKAEQLAVDAARI